MLSYKNPAIPQGFCIFAGSNSFLYLVQPSVFKLLLPTAWLPSVEYFALIATAAPVTIEVVESYPKQTCRNRCYIATANKVMPLSVPVVKTDGNHTRTDRMGIAYTEPWQRNHWRTIEAAYRNSAWFIHYEDDLKHVFFERHQTLVAMNDLLIQQLARSMKLKVALEKTRIWSHSAEVSIDLRGAFEATNPLIPHDPSLFPSYFQNFADRYGFQSNLSVIDLLFNCGPEAGDYLKTLGEKLLKRLSPEVINQP
ncbi:MAG: hypothetical protein A2X11_08495 [Bacteroidetes bacterium GWE2_42_24]|nr:MAG: hypothetical protein A2X11_08495 [Bacteroidetes bacterium GWE2_42_24]OFY30961.1 MAG: hypothetical protein A2X09_17270 [Bacteroidetes bacterium GWF2_43_11]